MEFVQIFSEMNWISIALLSIGLLFVIIEIFVPNFGFFGVAGILSLIAAVIVRICGGLNLTQSLILILMVIGFLCLSVMFMVWGAKYGILGKSGLFERRSTLSTDYNEPERKLRKLVGKNGKTISALNLGGKAKIKGEIYDVVSISSFIEEGKNIKVVEIKDNTIMVRKWFE